jgi:dihydrofolate reductase
MITIIAAASENNALGKDNDLVWHLPDDFKRFKELTSGSMIVMGKNTWLSLPVKPLPNRENIVVTRTLEDDFAIKVQGDAKTLITVELNRFHLTLAHRGGQALFHRHRDLASTGALFFCLGNNYFFPRWRIIYYALPAD